MKATVYQSTKNIEAILEDGTNYVSKPNENLFDFKVRVGKIMKDMDSKKAIFEDFDNDSLKRKGKTTLLGMLENAVGVHAEIIEELLETRDNLVKKSVEKSTKKTTKKTTSTKKTEKATTKKTAKEIQAAQEAKVEAARAKAEKVAELKAQKAAERKAKAEARKAETEARKAEKKAAYENAKLTLEQAQELREKYLENIGKVMSFVPFLTSTRVQALVKAVVIDKRVNKVFYRFVGENNRLIHKSVLDKTLQYEEQATKDLAVQREAELEEIAKRAAATAEEKKAAREQAKIARGVQKAIRAAKRAADKAQKKADRLAERAEQAQQAALEARKAVIERIGLEHAAKTQEETNTDGQDSLL